MSGIVPPFKRVYRTLRVADWRADGGRESAFSEEQVRERLAAFEARTRWLGIAGASLWLYLFGVAPLVVYVRGLASTWPYLLLALVIVDGLIAALLFRAHRGLYPAKSGDAWMKSFVALASPLDAVRSGDYLARELLVSFHPIAVAAELSDEATFATFARMICFDLARASGSVETSGDLVDNEREHLADVERLLARRSMLDDVTGVPARRDPDALAFCPRCGVEYHRTDGLCADCDRVPVRSFS